MKPVYLEFCGVNSFSEKAVIDFRRLLSGGVFGIFGDTGSGKSTILDCIHIALYGKLERSAETDCINHKRDGYEIVFEFETSVEGERRGYRVERTRNRKRKVEARLYEWLNGAWVAIADGTTEVTKLIERILGLSYDDFKLCIALPQGEFAGLLKATPKARLTLVSRLFDLGRYGEKLNVVIRERLGKARGEVELYKGLMEGAEECTEEQLALAEARLAAIKSDAEAAQRAWTAAQELFVELEKRYAEKQEYDEACARLTELECERAANEAKKQALALLPIAKRYQDKHFAVAAARQGIEREEKRLSELTARIAQAEETLCALRQAFTAENFDGRIAELNKTLGLIEAAQADFTARNDAEQRLKQAQAEYQTLKRQIDELREDFDGTIAQIDARLAELGEDEGLSGFVKRNFGDEVRNEVYEGVREDLQTLKTHYPDAGLAIDDLMEKYAPRQVGEAFDFARAKARYDALEQERKRLNKRREEALDRKRKFDQLQERMSLLLEKGKHAREEYDAAEARLTAVRALGTAQEIKNKLAAVTRERLAAEQAIADCEKTLGDYRAQCAEAKSAKAVYEDTLLTETQAFKEVAAEGPFADLAEAQDLIAGIGNEARTQAQVEAFFREYTRNLDKKTEAERRGVQEFSLEKYAEAKAEKESKEAVYRGLLTEQGKEENALKTLRKNAEKYAETAKRLQQAQQRCDEWEKLLKLLTANRSGKTLMEFVASEYLQEICAAATVTLLKLTGGRYFLRYNAEFFVGDNLDGGNLRGAATLSGGETFLVSLSLALALSAAICQKSMRPAEFFFLDEGFGTLDRSLVDTVMDVLGKVSAEFSVGLISHVEELKLRIENKIEVTGATKTHGSSVRVIAY